MRRIHLLPLSGEAAETEPKLRLCCIASRLLEIREREEVLHAGDLVTHADATFAVLKCDPPSGPLGLDTRFFMEGNPLVRFAKIQFTVWGSPGPLPVNELFEQCIKPYFSGLYDLFNLKRVRLLCSKQTLQVGEFDLQVEATEPFGLGVVTPQTEIFVRWDSTPTFEKVHIVPFQETLPRAYHYDVFFDYLQPFLQANFHMKLQRNDRFCYHGVRFKVAACTPDVAARVGKDTLIYYDGHVPAWQLPTPDASFEVGMVALPPEVTRQRGLSPETMSRIEEVDWHSDAGSSQATCMICLNDFATGSRCRRLPCGHVFHSACADQWLRRCVACPLCKANVGGALQEN